MSKNTNNLNVLGIFLAFLVLLILPRLGFAANPTVSITAPANNSAINVSTAFNLVANPATTNPGATITRVDYYNNGSTLIGTATAAPWTVSKTITSPLTLTLTAKVTDSTGATATSSAITVKINDLPTVGIALPSANVFYLAPFSTTLTANTADTDGSVSKVEYYNGTTLIGAATTAPWSVAWNNVPVGVYSLTAKATDNNGGVGTSTVVTVTAGVLPTVSLTSPTNNAVISTTTQVVATANPATTNPGATVKQVLFYLDGAFYGTAVKAAPWTMNMGLPGAGNHTISATVYDTVGASASSPVVNVFVNAPPTVSLTAPTNGASFAAPATITLTANASDTGGSVSKVEFYNGATLIGTATASPWTAIWSNVTAGTYSITAKATDNNGTSTTSSAVSISVSGSLPTVSLTAPANNSIYAAPATFSLTANPATTNAGVTISKVEFYKGTTLVGTATAAPWTVNQSNITAGTYSYTAKVTDSAGLVATSSAISVKVNALPVVTITSPATGTFFNAPATIALTASASDTDGTISKVEFYSGTTLIGTSTASPWTFTWNNVTAGMYVVTAKATDSDGATTTSTGVTVSSGTLPTIGLTSSASNGVISSVAQLILTATPATTNSGATISRVDFYKGTTLVESVTAAPWVSNRGYSVPGTYSYTAKVTDSAGATATSSAISVKVSYSPSVSILTPSTGAFYAAPASVALTASASDADGTVSKVEYYNGATLIGTATASPWTVNWSNVAVGSYSVTAKATDNLGLVTTSAAVSFGVGNAPTVSLTAPANNSVYAAPATFSLTANPATTNAGATISKVEFYRGATLVGTATASPWTVSQTNVTAGTYSYTAKVTDSIGGTATSSAVSVKVNALPTVSISSPSNNAFFAAPATITLTASASDTDGTISKVEFYNGATLIGTATASPWTVTWSNVVAGAYAVTAKATDSDGGVNTSTSINLISGSYPTVSMTATTNGTGTTPPFNFTLNASAATTNVGGSISSVAYYNGATLIGTATTAPWAVTWSGVTSGTYNLTAMAKDNLQNATTSAPIQVVVGNFTPVIITTPPAASTPTSASRTSAFEYDAVSGLLTKEIIEPDDPDLCLVTTYTYDAYGNKNSATTRNCNGSAGSSPGVNTEAAAPAGGGDSVIELRTVNTTWDTQGRFPITSTNALSQSESKTFDPKFGTVLTLTGPNALTTTWTYDSFGRPLTEARADGTSTTTTYTLCDATCPSLAKYKIAITQAGVPSKTSYYDMHDRGIRSETQGFDGVLVYSDSQYDKLGRTIKASRPYKNGTTAVWVTTTYDALNRVTSTTLPDASMSSIDYRGLMTISVNSKSQTKTEIHNGQGQLISVTDTQNKTLTYAYDAFGNLISTTDAQGNVTTVTYDKRGRKVAMTDPDQGAWSYVYDALGQLKRQTDAKSQVVSFTYDKLGRMLTRAEPDLNSTWTYDNYSDANFTCQKAIGKICKESTDNGFTRKFAYDAYGRLTAEIDNLDTGYGVAKNFDSYGRVSVLAYPSGLQVRNVYNTVGYLSEVRNATTNALYWQANAMDAEGHLTQDTLGNGIITNRTFDANTGRLSQTQSGIGGNINNQTFVFDTLGNLTQRYDTVTGLNESFGYDSLNRLTATSAVSGTLTTSVTVAYDAIGNILSKSDIGSYTYGKLVNGKLVQPHAVTNILMNDGVTVYGTYTYDANGNQLTGAGRTMAWTSWNMPSSVTGTGRNTPSGIPSSSFGFVYNSEHERIQETLPNGTILYNISPRVDTGIHVEKRVKTDGTVEYQSALYAGSYPLGSVVTNAAGVVQRTRYYHTDHLGSIVAITDEAGNLVERRSYDAWGKRRNLNGTSLNNAFVTPDVRHGFTGHEEMDDVGLIHMNGRLYDPATGRFLSADPTVQYPDDMQNYNRYSYIDNNPLCSIDPSGYGFWKSLFHSIKRIFKAVVHVVKAVLRNPVVRMAAAAAAAYFIPGMSIFAGHEILAQAAGGFVSGLISSRGDLHSALSGAFSGVAFGMIHDMPLGSLRPLAHGIASGVGSVIGGGDFKSGFLSGGFGSFAGSLGFINSLPMAGQLVSRMVVGGASSVIGGGKFDNGAMTAAFGYLYNDLRVGDSAKTTVAALRAGSPLANTMLNALDASSRIYYVSVGSACATCGGGEYTVNQRPYPGLWAILFEDSPPDTYSITVDKNPTVPFVDIQGKPFMPSPERLLAHELGHAYSDITGGSYDDAIKYENKISSQLNSTAPVRAVSDHGKRGMF